MDTKWKNKLIYIVLIVLFTFGLKGSLAGISASNQFLIKGYFQSSEFEHKINEFISYLNRFELNYMTAAEMKQELSVTQDEIIEHRERYGSLNDQVSNIRQQYEPKIQEAEAAKNKEAIEALIVERDTKINDIKENFASDDHIRLKIIKEKEQQINEYLEKLETYRLTFENLKTEFVYLFKDTATGKIYTNLDVTSETEIKRYINNQTMLEIRNYPSSKYGSISTNYLYNMDLPHNNLVNNIYKEKHLIGQIAVSKESPATSSVLANYHDFQQTQIVFLLYILSSLLALIFSIYWFRNKVLLAEIPWEKFYSVYNRIPLDIRGAIFLIISLITFSLLNDHHFYLLNSPYDLIVQFFWDSVIAAVFVIITIIQGKYWYERISNWQSLKEEWPKSLIYKTFYGFKGAFINRSLGTRVILILAIVFAFGAGFVGIFFEPAIIIIYAPLFLVVGLPILVMILRRIGYFNQIVHVTSELAQGNFSHDVIIKGKSTLSILANNVNILKNGVKQSQKEQAKSERLKTELITNVSHDLRTPLTSIITYTELLKTPNLSDEDREAYIHIIDRKSKRLKILIEDLFEASKMASGNIELVKDKVDIVQLLQQALAERDDAISESTLNFRVTTPDNPIYAYVDGQKLWRAFDNLIGNILKYSLENTRVYITVTAINQQVIITFKNITKYELGENTDELFERFKRGDMSRHTEGSGLGLAIAKSIIDLHEGSLDIDIDGDLFKITITLKSLS